MPNRIHGTVVAISPEGNLVTDIGAEQLTDVPTDESVSIRCDAHETNGIFTPDHHEPESTLLAILPPDRTLEITIVGVSATIMLSVGIGGSVVVSWR